MTHVTGRLADRGIVITGATGIAAASAHRFGAEGARVFLISRTAAHCQELVDVLSVAGIDAAFATADLTDDTQVRAAVDAAAGALGRIDGLFAVAGGSGRRFGDALVHEMTTEGWDRTLALNARTQVLTIGAVVRGMLEQEPDAHGARGAICTMSSILAFDPEPELFPTHAYAASKGAIATLTRSMAAAYVRAGIRVNGVAPALTTSRMSARAAADEATQRFAHWRQPLVDGFLDGDEVAATAAFLLSSDARAITGQVLLVDGGWSVTSGSQAPE
ncbi:MAG: SDR family oxidoreductase [Chloroflexi bacterium]|nr:SDR family oxidoreductase [Chloroflexota bacterium]